MKKRTIVIILLICLLIDAQRVSAAETCADDVTCHLYPAAGTVYEIDRNNDTVHYTDGINNWSFYGIDDWMIGDTVLTIMHDNDTQNTVKDDIIVSIRYSNVKIEY